MARRQLKTSTVAGGEYTGVGERVMAFREDHPRGKITTRSDEKENGEVVFKTFIWKDKSEFIELIKSGVSEEAALQSADSEASSRGNIKGGKKDYEKQETISLGRALAYLGYSGNGQIASTEEMEDYHSYKKDKFEESIETSIEYLKDADSIEDLQKRWINIDSELRADERVSKAKDNLKLELEKKNNDNL